MIRGKVRRVERGEIPIACSKSGPFEPSEKQLHSGARLLYST
jgi:hypothetical protein